MSAPSGDSPQPKTLPEGSLAGENSLEDAPWEANSSRFCYVMIVSYDGTDFCGYQVQRGSRSARTVAGELERMLCTYFQVEANSLNMNASGRTDAGVHAQRQFVQFYLDHKISTPEAMPQRLNSLLPLDLRVKELREVSPEFSVRLHATSREYVYNIAWGSIRDPLKRRFQGFVNADLDVPAMTAALDAMIGTHDFAAFSNFRRDIGSTTRTITKCQMLMLGPQEAQIVVVGNGFLHKMVRHIVGAVVAVGRGKVSQDAIEEFLHDGLPPRILSGGFRGWHVADACGLHKMNVEFQPGSMDI